MKVRARIDACLLLLAALGIGAPADASLFDILLADSGGRLIRIDPVSGTSTILAQFGLLSRPNDLVVEASGDILIADQQAFGGPGGVIRIDRCTGAQSEVSSGSPFSDPFGIALDPSGRIVIGDRGGSGAVPPAGRVILVDPTLPPNTNKTILSSGGLFVDPEGVAVASDGGLYFLTADINALGGPGAIIRVDPVSGIQTIVAGGPPFVTPRDVEIAPNGDLIVADLGAGPGFQGAVFRVDPVGGSISFVSFGQLFIDPSGVAIEPDGNILVADVGPFGATGSIIRVDPNLPPGANQTLVATGFPLVDPADLVVYPRHFGEVSGTVAGTCGGTTSGVFGVPVDLFGTDANGFDFLVASTVTDENGHYAFEARLGRYFVGIVLPLGFTSSTSLSPTLDVCDPGAVESAAFDLTCLSIAAAPRSMGYWKHQVNAHLSGLGSAQESLPDLLLYIDLIVQHFNENIVNPVIVYVPGSANPNDQLAQLRQLLALNQGATMLDRAKQQLLSLLLNVVAGKIHQTDVVSPNGATVSQAITYANDLIVDLDLSNDETAKDIAERINTGRSLPAGMVPASTQVISYKGGQDAGSSIDFGLRPDGANPMRGNLRVSLSLPTDKPARLEVFDVAGRRVAVQDLTSLGKGTHVVSVDWQRRPAVGLYLVRLTQGTRASTGKFALIP